MRPDVILAADCAYVEAVVPLLLRTLADLTTPCPSATIYLGFKKRRRADMRFLKKARKAFQVAEICDQDPPDLRPTGGLFLYTLTRPAQRRDGNILRT